MASGFAFLEKEPPSPEERELHEQELKTLLSPYLTEIEQRKLEQAFTLMTAGTPGVLTAPEVISPLLDKITNSEERQRASELYEELYG